MSSKAKYIPELEEESKEEEEWEEDEMPDLENLSDDEMPDLVPNNRFQVGDYHADQMRSRFSTLR